MTMKPVETVKKLSDRKVQRALMQFFAPENYFTVHKALHQSGRKDLIGSGPKCLIPANPPREAIAMQKHGNQPAGKGGKKAPFPKGKAYQGKNPKPRGPAFPNDRSGK
ncbi:MAG: hypothetical protein ACI87O_000771 [Planctomycetota bacterium]|jgi:hypothetical protein